MELRQLKYFLRIVEFGNMTRAATSLHIAQSALSQQMRNLEAELGVRLFNRAAHGVSPTAAGTILQVEARQMLRRLDDVIAMVRSEIDRPSGEVALALPSSTAGVLAIALLQRVREAYPEIRLKFVEAPSAALLALLEAAEVDMAIVADAPARKQVTLQPLVEERLYVMQPRASVAPGTPLVLDDLVSLSWVLPAKPNSIRAHLDATFRTLQHDPLLIAEINATNLLLQAVKAGVGATVLPWSALGDGRMDEVAGGAFMDSRLIARPFPGPAPVRRLMLCTLGDPQRSVAAEAVQALVPDTVAQLIAQGHWKGARCLPAPVSVS